jgi:DNA-binding PadR family transcriptional regulator
MPTSILPGTLDLLILKAVSLGERHGYAVLLRVQQMTGGARLRRETDGWHRIVGIMAAVLDRRAGEV